MLLFYMGQNPLHDNLHIISFEIYGNYIHVGIYMEDCHHNNITKQQYPILTSHNFPILNGILQMVTMCIK